MDSKLPSKKSTRGEEIAAKTLGETNIQNFILTKIDFQLKGLVKIKLYNFKSCSLHVLFCVLSLYYS